MDNEEKRNVTILVLLFIFTIYSSIKPFFFNSIANSRFGRLIMVSFIIFACYYNVYLGFLSAIMIIALNMNLAEENIANIKPLKPVWVEPSGFYKFFGYERVRENFVTRGASSTQGKAKGTLKTSEILKRIDDISYDPEQESNLALLKEIPQVPELEKYNTQNYYISDLLNIQNALRPKDSGTFIASPVYTVK